MSRRVTITSTGREGRVHYSDNARAIDGYFEFGGGDVITIVSMGSTEDWARAHAWASADRAAILRFVADEVIRQKAPSCVAEIEDERGVILVRLAAGAKPPPSPSPAQQRRVKAAGFVTRLRDLKAKFAAGAFVAALVVGLLMWFGTNAFTVQPASGVPLNDAARYASNDPAHPGGVAVLIQKTDPHPLRWSGRGGNDTSSISILLVPIDGARPRLIPVARKLTNNQYTLARIIGSDGRTLWFDVAGLYGVRLRDFKLITPQDLQAANPSLDRSWWDDPRGMDVVDSALRIVRADRSAALAVDPTTFAATPTPPVGSNARFARYDATNHLAAGMRIAPNSWLGLHSAEDLAGEYRVGRWVRPVENTDETKTLRRLSRARLGAATNDGARRRIESIAAIKDSDILSAAFLRMDTTSEPIRLPNPDSTLMIHTSAPGLAGTLLVSRVDTDGNFVWSVDTGLDRFRLQRIMPGEDVLAFVGPRLPVPDELSEPFVVLLETRTGKLTVHSLWR